MLIVGSCLSHLGIDGEDDDSSTNTVILPDETSESWFTWPTLALFGIVLALIAVWVQVSRDRSPRNDIGYEKTMA